MFGSLERPTVLVLGLGESGLAMVRWCARHGCRVRVADTRAEPPHHAGLAELPAPAEIEFVAGAFDAALLDGGIELVALSPGLSPLAPDLAALLEAAQARGVPVWGELELFAQALRVLHLDGYAPGVLAITGTNGKTTTTALTGLLCARAGKRVGIAGNISPAVLDKLADALDADALPEVWVLEASSFQLHSAHSFAPDAAALLNVTQDHFDWHGSLDAYVAAKARIFGPGTVRILNRDDPLSLAYAAAADAAPLPRGLAPGSPASAPEVVTFGIDAPTRIGDFGLQREGGIVWLALAEAADDTPPTAPVSTRRRHAAAPAGAVLVKRLMPVDALHIRGQHNATNALAALALCRALGLPLATLLHGLRDYRGEPHRVELIATVAGVDYVDDSKGTNVGATVAALDGLGRRTVLIAGGEGKGQDFAPLAAPVTRWARAVLLVGRDAPLLRAALRSGGVEAPIADCNSLEAAVREAAALAQAGDTVLLSPACASFDMFRNYAHRAEIFRQCVNEVAADLGTII